MSIKINDAFDVSV